MVASRAYRSAMSTAALNAYSTEFRALSHSAAFRNHCWRLMGFAGKRRRSRMIQHFQLKHFGWKLTDDRA